MMRVIQFTLEEAPLYRHLTHIQQEAVSEMAEMLNTAIEMDQLSVPQALEVCEILVKKLRESGDKK